MKKIETPKEVIERITKLADTIPEECLPPGGKSEFIAHRLDDEIMKRDMEIIRKIFSLLGVKDNE